MVSKASDDLPDPLRPVITTRRSRGISMSIFLRLCSRAPLMIMRSICAPSAADEASCRATGPRRAGADGARGVFYRGHHARAAGHAAARDIEGGAMVGRGAHEGQSEGDIHGAIE